MSSTCPHNMANFGLWTAEIRWRVWDTPANFNGFRVLPSPLQWRRSRTPTKLCTMSVSWAATLHIHFWQLLPSDGILLGAKFTLVPSTHHRTSLSGYMFATKGESEKNVLNSNNSFTCPHNMVNFGLLTAEICWRVWGTPANCNGSTAAISYDTNSITTVAFSPDWWLGISSSLGLLSLAAVSASENNHM